MFPLHRLSFGVSGSECWTQPSLILGWEVFKKIGVDLLQKVPNSTGVLLIGVKSRGTHREETFDMPSSLCRMFSTLSREVPTV